MTYVVLDACIKCKHTDCVEVCPVDCFYEGENMLVIHPDECIDCGVCEPECPVDAIKPDTEPGLEILDRAEPRLFGEMAEYNGEEACPSRGREIRRGEGEAGEIFLTQSGGRGLGKCSLANWR